MKLTKGFQAVFMAVVLGCVCVSLCATLVNAQGGGGWQQLFPQNSPAARMDHDVGVIFDRTMVLFAGWSGSGLFLNDTWTLDAASLAKAVIGTALFLAVSLTIGRRQRSEASVIFVSS